MSNHWEELLGPVTERFSDFFERLPAEQQALIEQNSDIRTREAGQILIRQDESSDTTFVIEQGTVEVSVDIPDAKVSPPLTYLGKGDFVGEIGVLTDAMRTATVKAASEVTFRQFSDSKFKFLLLQVPGMAAFVARRLARQVTHTTASVSYNSACMDLSGKLPEFDLISVFYTVCSGAGTGELRVLSDRKDNIGMFFFNQGQIAKARFRHLNGPEACRQMFAEGELVGAFSYRKQDQPSAPFPEEAGMHMSIDDLLMDGALMRDIFDNLPVNLKHLQGAMQLSYMPNDFESDAVREYASIIFETCGMEPIKLADAWVKTGLSHVPFAQGIQALEHLEAVQTG
ncbi:MAG: cyclic nucleotide-binding domain-containing protein [Verrucomicrobiota bacterium]